jgi:hypothetical protein
MNVRPTGDGQKAGRILTREIGDRDDLALPPQNGTSVPTGAKMIAASNGSGAASSEAPAQTAPSDRANVWACVSPARVKANTLRSCQRQIFASHGTPTRCPTTKRSTASPNTSTTPTIS